MGGTASTPRRCRRWRARSAMIAALFVERGGRTMACPMLTHGTRSAMRAATPTRIPSSRIRRARVGVALLGSSRLDGATSAAMTVDASPPLLLPCAAAVACWNTRRTPMRGARSTFRFRLATEGGNAARAEAGRATSNKVGTATRRRRRRGCTLTASTFPRCAGGATLTAVLAPWCRGAATTLPAARSARV